MLLRLNVLAGGALALISACASAPTPADLVVTDVTVYSGLAEPAFRAAVAVKDGAFIAVDRDRPKRYAAERTIDGRNLFLMPGLWDMHVHLANNETHAIDAAAFPQYGVTSVRDLGGLPGRIAALSSEIGSSARQGPTIYSVGPTLNGKAFAPFHRAVATEEETRSAVDELAASGADMIKVHRAFKPELLPVVIEAAHAHGLKVTGHIPLGVHPLDACNLGMYGVEHVGSFIEALVSVAPPEEANTDSAIAYMESDEAAGVYACFGERHVFMTPTLVIYPAVARSVSENGVMPPDFAAFIAAMKRITLAFHESGALLLAGTDAAYNETLAIPAGSALPEELSLLQSSGVSPADIIVIATSNAARALGVQEKTGVIAAGKQADFLLLQADPGADIRNVSKLEAVFKGGVRQDISKE